jgi:hypothetical protein
MVQEQTKSAAQLVYVDAAGIENREEYDYGYCKVGQRFSALKSGNKESAKKHPCLNWKGVKLKLF